MALLGQHREGLGQGGRSSRVFPLGCHDPLSVPPGLVQMGFYLADGPCDGPESSPEGDCESSPSVVVSLGSFVGVLMSFMT